MPSVKFPRHGGGGAWKTGSNKSSTVTRRHGLTDSESRIKALNLTRKAQRRRATESRLLARRRTWHKIGASPPESCACTLSTLPVNCVTKPIPETRRRTRPLTITSPIGQPAATSPGGMTSARSHSSQYKPRSGTAILALPTSLPETGSTSSAPSNTIALAIPIPRVSKMTTFQGFTLTLSPGLQRVTIFSSGQRCPGNTRSTPPSRRLISIIIFPHSAPMSTGGFRLLPPL